MIEPDKARSALVVDLLRDLGCAEVTAIRDGDAAFSHLASKAPRIILCAARMTPMDGFDLTRRLRCSPDVRSNETSLVLTFAGIERRDVLASLNAGADAVLTFPMSRGQLATMLSLLDTQKRPFVRSATYVGPCRRRGLVSAETRRRLEDFGAPDALASMMAALKTLFDRGQRGPISASEVEACAQALAAFLRAARPDRAMDEGALWTQCRALVRQFSDHAPGQKSFDHAFAPLRKLLTNVVLKDAAQPDGAEAAAA
ncbi:MAG: response regulator [Hyphomonadaceae bacterium]|nr:response regulator [Hyphomonadaceae bacterium]